MKLGASKRCVPLRCGGNIVGLLRVSLPHLTLEECDDEGCCSAAANKINHFYNELEATYISHFTALYKGGGSQLDIANIRSTNITVSVGFADVSERFVSRKRIKTVGKYLAIERSCTLSSRGENKHVKPCLDVFDLFSGEIIK